MPFQGEGRKETTNSVNDQPELYKDDDQRGWKVNRPLGGVRGARAVGLRPVQPHELGRSFNPPKPQFSCLLNGNSDISLLHLIERF